MRWAEIIRLRVPPARETETLDQLKQMVMHLVRHQKTPPGIHAFQRARPTGDITLVLLWTTDDTDTTSSRPGVGLLNELRCLGLVNHSVWIDLTEAWLREDTSG